MEYSCTQEVLRNQEMKNRSYADAVRNSPRSRTSIYVVILCVIMKSKN